MAQIPFSPTAIHQYSFPEDTEPKTVFSLRYFDTQLCIHLRNRSVSTSPISEAVALVHMLTTLAEKKKVDGAGIAAVIKNLRKVSEEYEINRPQEDRLKEVEAQSRCAWDLVRFGIGGWTNFGDVLCQCEDVEVPGVGIRKALTAGSMEALGHNRIARLAGELSVINFMTGELEKN